MKKIYYLSTCDTCKRILKELPVSSDTVLQDVKTNPVTEEELSVLKEKSGTYESLFNRRAKLYKERDLKSKSLSETDYKELLLEHYTFLKRPIVLTEDEIFVGNSKKTVAAAKNAL